MIPFTRPPLLEFSPTGESMAFVDPALSGPGVGTFRVLMLDPSGATVYDHRFPFDPDPIPRSVRDSALADRLEGLQERGMPELARSLTREGVLPEVYPPFTGAIVEPDGRLWIESRSRDEERTYLILDPDGGPEAWTTVPANTTIRAVDGDYVWGTARDEFGVESVVRFRRELERPPG